jgi:hypothetical protein
MHINQVVVVDLNHVMTVVVLTTATANRVPTVQATAAVVMKIEETVIQHRVK